MLQLMTLIYKLKNGGEEKLSPLLQNSPSLLIILCFHDGGHINSIADFFKVFLPHRITRRVKIVDKNLYMSIANVQKKII